jgi:hypothetical protein
MISILFAIAKSTFMRSHETSPEYHLSFVAEGSVPSEVPVTVVYQHIPDRFPDIPFLFWQTRYLIENYTMVEPWYLCSNLLHELGVTPGFSKFPHVFQVPDKRIPSFQEIHASGQMITCR